MRRWLRRVLYVIRQRRIDADLAEELELHRELRQRELESDGLSPHEAAFAARRAIGNVTLAREDARAVWIWPSIDSVWQDVKYGARTLRSSPAFTAVAMLTLALGIGANTAIFSVINAVLLRPLPYAGADRLVTLWSEDARRSLREEPVSFLNFADWRSQSQLFADMAIFRGEPTVILGGENPERVLVEFVSANVFPLLGTAPVLGRTFTQDEQDREEAVAVLSYGLWQRRFGGAPDAVGKTLTLDGRGGTVGLRIVGVMPPGFTFPNRDAQFWRPADRDRTGSRYRFFGRWGVVGRLKPATTIEQARSEMTTIGQRLAQTYPVTEPNFPGFGVNVVPLLEQMTGQKTQSALWILLSAVGLVLLIACVNAASLLLARGASRARELAIRTALGAGRVRLLRQLMIETALLTLLAGVLGLTLAGMGIRAVVAVAPAGLYPTAGSSYVQSDSVRVRATSAQPGIPRLDEISVDSTVLAFTIGLSSLTSFLFGLFPAWRLSRSDPNEALKHGAVAKSGRAGRLLIAVECALAVLLLAGSGLLIRSVLRLQSVDPGFRSDGVLLARVSLAPVGQRVASQNAQDGLGLRQVFYNQVFERLGAMRSVQGVGVISDLLVRGRIAGSVVVTGRPAMPAGELAFASLSPGFLETLNVPLRRGRFFSHADTQARVRYIGLTQEQITKGDVAPPVIVNESFARRFLPDIDPVGTKFGIGRDRFEIVGVVGDMRREGPERAAVAELFNPYIGETSELALRTSADPLALADTVRRTIQSIDKNAMVLSVTTLDRRLGELGAERRAQTWLLTMFAGLALGLAAIGIYGIVRYGVAQRTREIGIRIALGATTPDVLRLIVGQGMVAPLVGATCGLLCAFWLTAVMSHLLFEVSATDPPTFAAAAVVLAAAAFVACWLPARKAAKVDPIVALRCE